MSVQALTWALGQNIPNSTHKFVLIALANFASSSGESWPSLSTICNLVSIHKEETAASALKALEDGGWIKDTGQRCGNTGRIKVYQLPDDVKTESPANRRFSKATDLTRQSPVNPPSIPRLAEDTIYKGTSNQEPNKMSVSDQCSKVYESYPLKVGRPAAIPKIEKAIKKFGFDLVLERTKLYSQKRNGDIEFVPNPSTWFNQERFNDDPETWVKSSSGVSPSSAPVTPYSLDLQIKALEKEMARLRNTGGNDVAGGFEWSDQKKRAQYLELKKKRDERNQQMLLI